MGCLGGCILGWCTGAGLLTVATVRAQCARVLVPHDLRPFKHGQGKAYAIPLWTCALYCSLCVATTRSLRGAQAYGTRACTPAAAQQLRCPVWHGMWLRRWFLRALQPRHRPAPVTYPVHGRSRTDPFQWMQAADLRAVLQTEAQYCRRVLGSPKLRQFQREAEAEMTDLVAEGDVAVRERVNGYEYWVEPTSSGFVRMWRRPVGEDAETGCARPGSPAPEADPAAQLVVDVEAHARAFGTQDVQVSLCRASDDNMHIACLLQVVRCTALQPPSPPPYWGEGRLGTGEIWNGKVWRY